MPLKLVEIVSDPTPSEKELIRKLYWSITSTLTLDRDQKAQTFAWCARVGTAIISRAAEPHLPLPVPTSTAPDKFTKPTRESNNHTNGKALGLAKKKVYDALAGGGADRVQSTLPSSDQADGALRPVRPYSSRVQRFADYQLALRRRAELYLGWGDGTA